MNEEVNINFYNVFTKFYKFCVTDYHGYWSRRINEKDRLVYKIKDEQVIIVACRTHYGDK